MGWMRRVLACAASVSLGPACHAQLSVQRPCALLRQPIEAVLAAPERDGTDCSLELIQAATGKVLQTRPVKPGPIDLGEVFPRLWTNDTGQVYQAQALLGTQRTGPPLVLTPMVTPRYVSRIERDGLPIVPPAPKKRPLSGYWVYLEQRVSIRTSKGELVFALRPDAAPNSVAVFRDLVQKRFYQDIKVHRIASLSGRTLPDILQLGDPTGTGQGGPGFFLDFEPSPLKHALGTLSLARTAEPNSAGSQLIITLSREAGSALDGRYAVFGELISGGETLRAISKTPVDADGRPREDVIIESARLIDAPPAGTERKSDPDPLEEKAR